MECNFNQLVSENITIPSMWRTVSKIRAPKRMKISDKFLVKLQEEYQSQLPAYTSEDGRVDIKKCKEDFKKILLMAITQL